ncbi:MAG: hypothetical protein EHM85_09745 [Desulfobacteraceae bacterium]|nr:MAG: hypothetical protein EHM85_09745 [Desulfobacteraceae bacterium]
MKTFTDLKAQNYLAVASNYGIEVRDAKRIVEILNDCFDIQGRFIKNAFERNIPELARFEKKIFEILWHNLKNTLNRNDRVVFLNSLQMLVSKMGQPQKAMAVLLSDIYNSTSTVSISDRNAFVLSNLFLRKYNKERDIDIEMTPEEVILVKDGLDRDVVKAASDILEGGFERTFKKSRTIHNNILELLDNEGSSNNHPMTLKYLFSLQREMFMFLSLVGGRTSRSVIRDALGEYGNPEAKIFMLSESSRNIPAFLQQLKVTVRILARLGVQGDAAVLEKVKSMEQNFLNLGAGKQHEDQVGRVMLWVEKSKNKLLSST